MAARASALVLCLLAAGVLAACGGDGKSQPVITSTPFRIYGTPDVTGVIRVAVPTQTAKDAGRKDCPKDWLAYREEAFAICYPSDHYADVWSSTSLADQTFTVRLIPGEPVAHTPFALAVWAVPAYEPPSGCFYDNEAATAVPDEREAGVFDLGHIAAEGCMATLGGSTQYGGVIRTIGGQVNFRSQAASSDQLDLAKRILGTLIIAHPYSSDVTPGAPTATPLPYAFCARTDIAAAVSLNALTGGQLVATITLGNRSGARCQISRYPDVELLDVHNDVVPTDVTAGASCPNTVAPGVSQCVADGAVVLEPGLGNPEPHTAAKPGQAHVELRWNTHDGSGACPAPPPAATAVRLLLHDVEQTVVVDVTGELPGGIVPCDGMLQLFAYGSGS